VDEIQIVRTSATSVAEVQRVDVSVEEIDEVQILGIFIEGIDTSSCTSINAEQVGRECSAIETKLSGNFQLYFDVEACGDQTGTDLTNWCAAAIAENHPDWGIDMDSLVDWTPCSSGSQCQTGTLTITSTAEEVADELNNLYYEVSGDQKYYMKDPQGKGVNVTRTAGATKINSASGVYHIRYEISFDGQHLRGDVPELYVASASGFALTDESGATFLSGGTALTSYEYKIWGNAEGYGAGDSHTYVGALNADCNPGSESCSYVTAIEGNQPAGTVVLAYECAGRTQDVISATVTQNSK
jgi:hypothetical protein